MSALKSVFTPKSTKNSSSKNPKFYNEKKNRLIATGATHNDPAIRRYFASSENTPTRVLAVMLEKEQDKGILREVLLNPSLPRKSVVAFVSNEDDHRVAWFDSDEELIEHFQQ